MNPFSLDKEKNQLSIFLGLFLLALIVRTGLMICTIDVPGDGPTRAIGAYCMFLSPTLITYGVWLPGYNYLHSGFYFILANPAVTSRVVNVILGALTVPLFYLLVTQSFDHSLALMSALVLIFLPLHVGLSASSLTEPTFLFEFITGSLALILTAKTEKYQLPYLLLTLVLLSLAITTRYEGWVLIPIFVVYYCLRTHRILWSIVLATVLLIYPTIWTISNYLHSGDPFLGFTMATGRFHGTRAVSWLTAIPIIIHKCIDHLGWMLSMTMVLGIALQCIDLFRKRCTLERVFYCLVTLTYVVVIYCFTITRGNDVWDRYLLFGFVLVLPFSILPYTYFRPLRRNKRVLTTVALLAMIFVAYNPKLYKTVSNYYNNLYVTFWRPSEIINISKWLKSSIYRDYVILLTENGGQSWYFPTYFPDRAIQHCVIAPYAEDAFIDDYCLNIGKRMHIGNYYLFITNDGDRVVKERVENLVGGEIGNNRLIHTEGHIRIYDISNLLRNP